MTIYQPYTSAIAKRSRQLQEKYHLTRYDARHIASAEIAGANFFITSDRKLIRKYGGVLSLIDPLLSFEQYGNTSKNI
jgi:predicted nucleic acid-binding protein